MGIETNQTKIFETKTKTNFTITLQLVKQEEFLMRSNYPLSENLERKIKKKLMDIVSDEFKSNATPKKAFMKMSSKIDGDGNIQEGQKRESFRGTIDKLLSNSAKIEAVDENFSLYVPLDNRGS